MKTIIKTDKAPAPIGPYNQAILVDKTLYISGQIALNPATGDLVMNSLEDETKQVMENLKAVLTAAGMGFDNVVKTTIFLNDMSNFARVNVVYGNYIKREHAPARETVAVAGLPKAVNVEISMIAVK
ncbi:RidA family protein [Abyssalbus ytuae]|uniref:RidA family protein n=1 Tax=Abyssalbus ytuae TaxID=2926907 RepID=A0A9E6ZLW3_9FLAO|nr:RidA family protein [Abyssalbus ytuae]UOB18212.1 RidA family protein [Abyssalbus ytuae]